MYELTILLEENGKEPLYEQIYRHIREEIRQGKIPPGTKLPSTRLLAEHLGVSRSTSQLAYDQLTAEGYLEARPCKGYFAASVDGLCEIKAKNTVEPRTEAKPGSFRYDFSPRGIDSDGFPSHTWKKLAREVLSEENGALFDHGDSQGELGLREAIRDYLYSARGVNCRAEQILVGAGSEYLLMLLNQIVGGRTVIAMENPTYMQAYRVFRGLGNQVVPIEMDEQGMEIEALNRSGATLAYVMPSHQFPTGKIMPLGRRMELIAWASSGEERYIIEDDYDSEFRYRGKPIPALQGYDQGEHVIYLGTFSRSIAPGIRISFLVLPEPMLLRYRARCRFYATTVSRIDQEILTRFIREGYYERHLNRMKSVYRAKHDLLLELLKPFQSRFIVRGENAGIHLLLEEKKEEKKRGGKRKDARLRNGTEAISGGEENQDVGTGQVRTEENQDVGTGQAQAEEERLTALAREAGVKVYGLSGYYVEGRADTATILLGFANLSQEEITRAVEKLEEAWNIERLS